MYRWKRTRSLISSLSVTTFLLCHDAAPAVAQTERFREDLQKAEAALNQHNYESAVSSYRDSIRDAKILTGEAQASATAQANLGLSRAYLGLGAFKNAIQSCDEALKYVGGNAALEGLVHNQRGLAIVASVSKLPDPALENAVTEFRKVLSISDQDPTVSYNLGVTLLKLNRDAEGIHELQVYLSRAGRTPEAGLARKMIDEPRRARENFAPDFSITTVNGEFVTLEDLRGKVVLLDFWGTWCPPCRESTPSLVKYSKKHSSEVFTIVGIAVNEPSEQGWRDYIDKNKMEWPQYIDSSRKMSNLFKVNAYPTYITIDADGVIRDRRTGWGADTMSFIDEQVKRAVKARLTSGPPAPKPDRAAAASAQPSTPVNSAPTLILPPSPSPIVTTTTAPSVVGATATTSANAANAIPSAGVSVRGHVTRLAGATPNLRVNLIQPAQPGVPAVSANTPVSPDGSFEFFNVRPGNYNLSLSMPVPFQPVVVGDKDINGIEFNVPAMRTLSGRAVLDGVGAAPARLFFTVVYANGTVGIGATIQPDGTFNVLLPEGEHRLALNAPGYYVRSMNLGSSDLLKDSLRLSDTDSQQLLVSLTPNPSTPVTPAVPVAIPVNRGGPVAFGEPIGVPNAAGNRGLPPDVTPPAVISQVQPQYTDQARQQRLQGSVTLQIVVRTDGTAGNIQVIRSLGGGLDEAAIEAIKQWRFRPASRNGTPVDVTISVVINFALRDRP
jgi:TonB family protein